MGKPAVFYILRHGETLFNQKGILQGHLDSQLSDLGIKQIEGAVSVLASIECDKIISSDLGRAVESAKIISKKLKLPVITDSRLRERNLGIAQGLTLEQFSIQFSEIFEQFKNGDPDFVIPDGESIGHRYERSVAFFEETAAANEGKRIVVITHGGVLDGVFRKIFGIPLSHPRKFSLYNASVNTVQIYQKEWRLLNWGYTAHLDQIGVIKDWYKGII